MWDTGVETSGSSLLLGHFRCPTPCILRDPQARTILVLPTAVGYSPIHRLVDTARDPPPHHAEATAKSKLCILCFIFILIKNFPSDLFIKVSFFSLL